MTYLFSFGNFMLIVSGRGAHCANFVHKRTIFCNNINEGLHFSVEFQ